jgi:DNA-3-methyladenine glycosylase II
LADDQTTRQHLLGFAGIGPWTADIYLLMALGRPDIWPVGDLALATAMRTAKRLADVPRSEEQLEMAEMWRPLRAVAARILWHSYLAGQR